MTNLSQCWDKLTPKQRLFLAKRYRCASIAHVMFLDQGQLLVKAHSNYDFWRMQDENTHAADKNTIRQLIRFWDDMIKALESSK